MQGYSGPLKQCNTTWVSQLSNLEIARYDSTTRSPLRRQIFSQCNSALVDIVLQFANIFSANDMHTLQLIKGRQLVYLKVKWQFFFARSVARRGCYTRKIIRKKRRCVVNRLLRCKVRKTLLRVIALLLLEALVNGNISLKNFFLFFTI